MAKRIVHKDGNDFYSQDAIRLRDQATVFDDLSIALTRDKQGQNSKPDYDFTNLGLLFPQNDAAEIIYISRQMKHQKLLDSDIMWHLHYIQDEAEVPIFKIQYKWWNNGAAVPAEWTEISTGDGSGIVFPYSSGSILQILPFPAISPPEDEGVSSHIDLLFFREDNVVTGDVLTKYIDAHFEIDGMGSRDEYVK